MRYQLIIFTLRSRFYQTLIKKKVLPWGLVIFLSISLQRSYKMKMFLAPNISCAKIIHTYSCHKAICKNTLHIPCKNALRGVHALMAVPNLLEPPFRKGISNKVLPHHPPPTLCHSPPPSHALSPSLLRRFPPRIYHGPFTGGMGGGWGGCVASCTQSADPTHRPPASPSLNQVRNA